MKESLEICKPKISVIIPVYNAANYLCRCMDSIMNQSFKEFEVLLINDGSKDDTGQICEVYKDKDKRIRVFYKENGGVSSARNVGLINARAEWVAFVDADDFLGEFYLDDLYADVNSGSELIVHNFIYVDEVTGESIPQWFKSSTTLYARDQFGKMMNEQSLNCRCHSFSKLFNRSIILDNRIEYPENVHFGEDCIFVFEYLRYVNLIKFSDKKNYYYINRPGSAIHRKFDFCSEYLGYKLIKNSWLSQLEEFGVLDQFATVISGFLHRAITMVDNIKDILQLTEEDILFFKKYFKTISYKTTIDRWVVINFINNPIVLLCYIKVCRRIRSIIVKQGAWKLLEILKK